MENDQVVETEPDVQVQVMGGCNNEKSRPSTEESEVSKAKSNVAVSEDGKYFKGSNGFPEQKDSTNPRGPNSVPPLVLQRAGKQWKPRSNLNGGVKMRSCKLCNYRTWKPSSMKAHKRTHILQGYVPRGRSIRRSDESALDRAEKIFSEHKFRKTLRHCQRKRPEREEENGEERARDVPFSSEKCTYRGYSLHHFNHAIIHTEAKPYKCDYCDYTTGFRGNLNVHMKSRKHQDAVLAKLTTTEEKEGEVEPPKQRQRIRANGDWALDEPAEEMDKTAEEARTVTEVPIFSCDQCSYWGNTHQQLIEHTSIHTGVKPFKCDECEYATGFKANLTKHQIRSHNKETAVNKDDCDSDVTEDHEELDPTFKPSDEWKYRTRALPDRRRTQNAMIALTHSGMKPYKRYEIECATGFKENLIVHSSYRDKKGLQCKICVYRAKKKDHLREHMKMHKGEIPSYKCNECNYVNGFRCNLQWHQRKHHRVWGVNSQGNEEHGNGRRECLTMSADSQEPDTGPRDTVCQTATYGKMDAWGSIDSVPDGTIDFASDHKDKLPALTQVKLESSEIEETHSEEYEGTNGFKTPTDGYLTKHQSRRRSVNLLEQISNSSSKAESAYEMNRPFESAQEEEDEFIETVHADSSMFPLRETGGSFMAVQEEMDGIMMPVQEEMDGIMMPVKEEIDGAMMPVQEEMDGATNPVNDDGDITMADPSVNDKMDQLPATAPDETQSNFPVCPVCLKSEATMFKFCCEDCHMFWRYVTKRGSGPPDCPGHTVEGEDLDCGGCRWGRYVTASRAWEDEIRNVKLLDYVINATRYHKQ